MTRSRSRPPEASAPTAAAAAPARFDGLDALRGLAMLWMAAFHFSFDLNQFGLLQPRQNFYADPFWTLQRLAIVTLFVGLAGVGQGLSGALGGVEPCAVGAGRDARAFWRRWAQIAGCAVLVSAGSWWMFPRSFIFFGVLHAMAAMLLLQHVAAAGAVRLRLGPASRRGLWLLAAGGLIVLPQLWTHPVFDSRWTTWVGLGTRKPVTEDFAPLMPWLGVFLLGVLAGDAWRQARRRSAPAGRLRCALEAGLPRGAQAVAALGRWPLSFYMLHQPVLIGLLQAGAQLANL